MNSTSHSCKDGASNSKSINDDVCEMAGKLQNISTADSNVSICANCGKEGANNICNKCKVTTYCNAVCKKIHKKKHKKECEEHQRLAAELHDLELFKQPPPAYGDCPICFLRIPNLNSGWGYQTCCGKVICCGCIHAPVYDDQGNRVDIVKQNECPFCRVVAPKSEKEVIERTMKRMEAGDPIAIFNLGFYYRDGTNGFPQDHTKALELFHLAGELGYTRAYNNMGILYNNGEGVEVDMKKATYYYELAAMRGTVLARYNIGLDEEDAGNMDRALKHYMIAVRSGDSNSLKKIKQLYTNGHASKDDYTKALQAYQEYLGEIKSKQRDEAAAAREYYRYY